MSWFEHGMIRALAEDTGISGSRISQYIHRGKRCKMPVAALLAHACKLHNIPVGLLDWAWNLESGHPAFSGEPVAQYPDEYFKLECCDICSREGLE